MIRRLLPFADCRDTPLRWVAMAVALCAAIASSTHAHAGPAPAQAAAPANLIQMDHISVQKIGRGSPVILIPGLSSPRAAWDGVSPELARRHTVYLVQVNGFGGEDPRANLKPGLLEGVVNDLATLIAQQKLKSPAVVGHSMGGLVGLMLAARHPDSVGRLMVVDALPWFAVLMAPPGTDVTMDMVTPQAARMRDSVAASYGKPPSKAAAEANVASLTRKPEARARATEWAMAADPRVVAEALYEDLTTDMRGELKAIRAPVTLVYAYNDQYPLKDRADAFFRGQYAAVPHINYVGIGDSAHFVMLDQPEAFAAALNGFLAG